MWIVILLAVLAAGAAHWYVATANRFAQLAVKVAEAGSGIDVALTRRWDTLTKMLDVTKGYAKHEAETLGGIVTLRQGMTLGEKRDALAKMDDVMGKLNVLVENYPDLKASENFKQLQIGVTEAEDNLQAARRIYNMNVSQFNQLLMSWPMSIVGRRRGYDPMDFFEAEAHKRQDVKMRF